MLQLKTFIRGAFRPEINGGMLSEDHRTVFYLPQKKDVSCEHHMHVNAICFGPKKDRVLLNLEHAILEKDNILIFYYEDMHKRWTYIQKNGKSYFEYKKNDEQRYLVYAKCLYIRGCQVHSDEPMWATMGEFYTFVDNWKGRVLCAPQKQVLNESKLYQLNNSLLKSASEKSCISIGKSYVIKGRKMHESMDPKKSYIVKSLSGVRSIVVDEKTHGHWDKESINHLPVLFQEKAEGRDLRVHVINKKTFPKLSSSKEAVDYRYDKGFFKLHDLKNLPHHVKNFACSVAEIEENALIGVDFIKTKSNYVVLEANPSPGWSAYHECNGIDVEPFMHELLKALKGD